MYIGLHIKYPLFLSDYSKTWIIWIFSKKYTNIKFNKHPSRGSRVVACGQKDGQMDGHDEAKSCFSQFCQSA